MRAGYLWSSDLRTLSLKGDWTTTALGGLDLRGMNGGLAHRSMILDGGGLVGLDTAGALVLFRLIQRQRAQGREVRLDGFSDSALSLVALVEARAGSTEDVRAQSQLKKPTGTLERIGRALIEGGREGFSILSFVGELSLALVRSLYHPNRFRWRQTLAVLEQDGVRAMPVLGMLSFLLGVVIAYQSGVQLRLYGGNLYVVDLVGITVLRELGPLMTAIVVAGRSGSAYTAQIGTMQVTEEVDALRSIGVLPLDLLVLPKILGLMLALPLLSVFADLAAVAGAMVMAALMLDLGPEIFIHRFAEAVSVSSLLTGVVKAPVFALVIAVVGCYQGFQVRGGADSVGRHTTASVVQAIVLVIVTDAAFSVAYSLWGI